MTRRHRRPLVAPLVAALAIALAPSFAAADTVSATQKQAICDAIDILSAYDKCCKTESPSGFSPAISVSLCLKIIKLSGNFCAADLGPGGFGGKTLDDRTANCADKDVMKLAARMMDNGKRGADFIDLLATLYHEGTHALQDLSAVTTSDYKDKVTGPLEVQAWSNERLFMQQFKAALEKMLDNIVNGRDRDAGMTECQKKLMACFLDDTMTTQAQVEAMIKAACAAIALQTATIDGITAWLAEKCPPAKPPEGSPREKTEKNADGSKRAGSAPGNSCITLVDSSGATVLTFKLDTGLSEILGLEFTRDFGGFDHLIVSGHLLGSGLVQDWIDPTPGIPDPMVLTNQFSLGTVSSAPADLVLSTIEGQLLLWDELAVQMFALVDLSGDGTVDAIDPLPRYGLPFSAEGIVRIERTGEDEYLLLETAIGTMTGNLPSITVRDLDRDGVFSLADFAVAGEPIDDPRQTPNLCTRAFVGQTMFVAIGAPGHQLQLFMTDPLGMPLGPYSAPAIASADNEAFLNVIVPGGFQPGTFVRIQDLSTGALSDVYPVENPFPVVYPAIGNAGPGPGGTPVFQQGAFLDTLGISQVLVGGVPAQSFVVSPQGVQYVTPPNVPVPGDGIADHGHVADVQFVYDDGMLAPALFEAQPFAYLDPILLPEFECRKGNVNGGAGPVANVFFVNGSPGIGNARRVVLGTADPFVFSVGAPPSNPAGPARWAGYAWTRVPSAASHNALPFGLGNACLRMPFSPIGGALPKRTWNNIGKPGILGAADFPSSAAPSVALNRPGGIGMIVTFTLQGVMLDSGAPNGQAAVTNAVVVEVR